MKLVTDKQGILFWQLLHEKATFAAEVYADHRLRLATAIEEKRPRRFQIVTIIEICGSVVDIRCSVNASRSAVDIKSRRLVDILTTVMPKDRKKTGIFPRSDKKFTVQLHTKAVATDESKKNETSGTSIESDAQKRRSLQKKIITANAKRFTVEQTTRRSVSLKQSKRGRLMKRFDEILKSRKTDEDKNEHEFDDRKKIADVEGVLSEGTPFVRTQLYEADTPLASSDINNLNMNRGARQVKKEGSKYSVGDTEIVSDIDAGENEDREEFLFLDGDIGEEFIDGPIRIDLLDGILGELSKLYGETESVTEIGLDDAEEKREKRYVIEEETVASTSAPKSSSVGMESAMVYDMTYKNIN